MIAALLAMTFGTRRSTCEWCGAWVLIGYRVDGRVFCSADHYHAWLNRRDEERFDDERG